MARVVVLAASVLLAALALLLAAAEAPAAAVDSGAEDLASKEALWALYERGRGRHAVARVGDKARSFNVFKENLHLIHDFNQRNEPYMLRLNRFGDMTADEFHRHYAGSRVTHHCMFRGEKQGQGFMYAGTVDWRQKGAVTDVIPRCFCLRQFQTLLDILALPVLIPFALHSKEPIPPPHD